MIDTRPFQTQIVEKLRDLRTGVKTTEVAQTIAQAEGYLANGAHYANEDFDVLQALDSALFDVAQRTAGFKGCP